MPHRLCPLRRCRPLQSFRQQGARRSRAAAAAAVVSGGAACFRNSRAPRVAGASRCAWQPLTSS